MSQSRFSSILVEYLMRKETEKKNFSVTFKGIQRKDVSLSFLVNGEFIMDTFTKTTTKSLYYPERRKLFPTFLFFLIEIALKLELLMKNKFDKRCCY